MILITGANGELGTATIEKLMANYPNKSIAGLVRTCTQFNDRRS